jgi:hypothetical protein
VWGNDKDFLTQESMTTFDSKLRCLDIPEGVKFPSKLSFFLAKNRPALLTSMGVKNNGRGERWPSRNNKLGPFGSPGD